MKLVSTVFNRKKHEKQENRTKEESAKISPRLVMYRFTVLIGNYPNPKIVLKDRKTFNTDRMWMKSAYLNYSYFSEEYLS